MENGKIEWLHCCVKDCKSKPYKWGFCSEHYQQFKYGLIRKDGTKAEDYDKKYEYYMKRYKKAA